MAKESSCGVALLLLFYTIWCVVAQSLDLPWLQLPIQALSPRGFGKFSPSWSKLCEKEALLL